jgi:hypothetical protein
MKGWILPNSFSQPTTAQLYPQNALIYASQPQNSITILKPVQLQNVEQNSSLNSENGENLAEKYTEIWTSRKIQTPKSKTTGLEEQ